MTVRWTRACALRAPEPQEIIAGKPKFSSELIGNHEFISHLLIVPPIPTGRNLLFNHNGFKGTGVNVFFKGKAFFGVQDVFNHNCFPFLNVCLRHHASH